MKTSLGHQVFVQKDQRGRRYRPHGDEKHGFEQRKRFRVSDVLDDVGERTRVSKAMIISGNFEPLSVVIEERRFVLCGGAVVRRGHGEERATHTHTRFVMVMFVCDACEK